MVVTKEALDLDKIPQLLTPRYIICASHGPSSAKYFFLRRFYWTHPALTQSSQGRAPGVAPKQLLAARMLCVLSSVAVINSTVCSQAILVGSSGRPDQPSPILDHRSFLFKVPGYMHHDVQSIGKHTAVLGI